MAGAAVVVDFVVVDVVLDVELLGATFTVSHLQLEKKVNILQMETKVNNILSFWKALINFSLQISIQDLCSTLTTN